MVTDKFLGGTVNIKGDSIVYFSSECEIIIIKFDYLILMRLNILYIQKKFKSGTCNMLTSTLLTTVTLPFMRPSLGHITRIRLQLGGLSRNIN